MALVSMTGFARDERVFGAWSWVWEAKSVNGRSLDVRVRLPVGLEGLEGDVRALAARHARRGNLQLALALNRSGEAGELRLNPEALRAVLSALREVMAEGGFAPPDPASLLAIRGVLEPGAGTLGEAEVAARNAAILESAERVLTALAAARAKEGTALAGVLGAQVRRLGELSEAAAASAALAPEKIRERIRENVRVLIGAGAPIGEDRLAQELALIAVKADVREELDRLEVHLAAARALLSSPEAAGRKLDFLTQELNREANTICSKAGDIALTQIGLDLKVVIDQMREQVQNIE